ncbi:NAD(P)/FAD-dependent oxidoreductase [Breoghania sp. L-A4]|uniref:NAD(P)/FAD-dependent oxidoreductase n=1 Tax=Breoghania sp. L-A4 TaxID=2304600 RepID=UPI000E35B72D|nr:NAD(P)/FAD-dependent oxidoreductase [Breoghania sp. L-A4]AXS41305.1 NAD(P)/FAD-dependent oxidoreductase [Breoghania sp. L-A4]
MTETVDTVVIGAGVVGLAVARELTLAGHEVIVLERHGLIGSEVSSRNSEVIHAGIYYDSAWLKTRLAVEGKALLYDYCASHGVAHDRIGKLIVACDEAQLARLDGILAQGRRNGVTDLRLIGRDEARELEPNVACVGAILSPSSGIIDAHGLMLALQGDAESHGAMVAFNAPVTGGRVVDGGIEICVGGAEPMDLRARQVVIAAALGAQDVADAIDGYPVTRIPPIHKIKGNYFNIAGRAPFNHLIYPVPVPGGLGTHATLDLGGQVKFGPDVDWDAEPDFSVDPARAEEFYGAIRSYYPDLADGALQPDYAGVRPKLSGKGEPAVDFCIQGPKDHGIAGLVALFGIESPGLTSSLAIARHTARLLP